jgi:aminopeptidase N
MSYPLAKISHVGVPDFFAGAMENWGIVVYRNQYLMFNDQTDSFKKKKRICEIIYHEVSHQWVFRSVIY